jgi:hypothetical protein
MQVMIVATEGVRERFVTGRSAENPEGSFGEVAATRAGNRQSAASRLSVAFENPTYTVFCASSICYCENTCPIWSAETGYSDRALPRTGRSVQAPRLKFRNNCRGALIVAIACRQLLLKNARDRGAPALLGRRPERRQDVSQKTHSCPSR